MIQGLIVSNVFLWAVALLNLFLILIVVRRVNAGTVTQNTLRIGQQAPPFRAHTTDGKTVTQDDYIGNSKESVLLFFSTTCAPCRNAMPIYKDLQPRAANAGINFVLVSAEGDRETEMFARECSIDFPIVVANKTDNKMFDDYRVPGTPYFYRVDKKGKIRAASFPHSHYDEWKNFTETLLNLEPSIVGGR